MCNGTRLIIKNIYERIIEAEISIGEFKGKIIFIPRMPLIPSDTNLPFEFQRLQFPVRPAFAITFNKSQGKIFKLQLLFKRYQLCLKQNLNIGQTLDFVSIWLGDGHVFTHGQLYVALSRVSSLKNIIIATDHINKLTKNVVFKEIFL